MSLLKRNGKSKKGQESSQSLDPPQSPSLFRKSTSIEPSGSDIERPQSQQSSRSSGKKKILPSFLSSFFGNNQKIPEVPQSVKNESEPGVEARATSHESINSVLSSSSFSYVNPTNMGGKRVKGKRIPVDDPNYGKTTVGKSKEEKKSSGLSTLDKIGIKMGLKKKYNLQSCESLQYIDACEDSDPIPLQTSSITNKNQETELPGTSNNPLNGLGQIEADSPGSSNAANPSPPTAEKFTKITVELQKLSELASSPDIISTSVPQTEVKAKDSNRFSDCSSQTVIEPPSTPTSSQIANQVIKKKSKKNTDSSPIVVIQVINDPPKVSPKAEPEPSITVLKSKEPIASTSNAPEPTTPAVMQPSQSTTVETILEKTPPPPVEEPQPSTSAAAALQFSFASNSNTWSNSGRRKRRAPLPPIVLGENPALPKFTNGLSKDLASTSIVSDTPNDVLSSSSGAAQLRKFTRIEKSPPPRAAFEIRPRKKERSVEPMPVTRPTSSFASAVATNTLFSSHNHRYHKRSCSEGTSSASSTLNRGKLHKQGKKRAPPPPNPFGDPDVPEEEAPSTSAPNSTLKLSSEAASAVPGTSSSSAVVSLPPTAPPKLHRKSSFTKSKSVDAKASTSKVTAQVSINPFDSEPETPSPPRTASPVPTSIAVADIAPTTSTSFTENSNSMENVSLSQPEQVTVPALDSVVNLPDCSPDLLEEIRQNMLNDQQERQQMGLLQGNNTQDLSMNDDMRTDDEINTDIENRSIASDRPVSVVQPSSSRTSTPISETDLVSAQRKLEVLASSIAARPSSSGPSASTVDPAAKAKLIELKKESDKSPLNALRNKSRPISLGSSIYESPLALFLGKASNSSAGPSNGNATNNSESSGESSPKITPKPWYKRGTSSALAKQLSSSKSKQQPQVKPFTSLVKFSELDKEATRIVEENRRKSAEQRMQETEQELLELFATLENSTNAAESGEVPSASNESPQTPRSVQIVTAAQVHTEGTSAEASSNGTVEPANDEARPASPSRTENSSPTFQSVHAASKHRKIKPLLTSSPGAIVRSEKLAIVQPQTNNTPSSFTGSASSSSTATSTSINSSPSIPTNHTSNSSNGPTTPSSVTATASTRAPGPEWDCPRCTLKNPSWRILCEICFQRKDPPASATSYISSILQRVNAESTKPATSSATTPTTPPPSTQTASSVTTAAAASSTSSFPTTPGVTKTQSSPTEIPSSIPSVVDNPPSTSQSNLVQDNQISTLSEPSSAIQPSTRIEKHDIPPCENFLSQLPDKHDHAKEEKLSGIKLHEDPELEELDIRKLRKARLAYFQKQQSTSKDSSENPQNDFSLSTSSMQKHNGRIVSSASETNELGSSAMSTNSTAKTFADNEDDFLDYILQLDSNPYENDPPNVQNISLLPVPLLSHFSPSQEETNGALSSDMNAPPSLSLSETNPSTVCMASPQTRFKPKLEAIVEGNSQDYAYCYSSSEVAKIYENWQTRPITSQNSVASLPNIPCPSGVSSQQNRNNLVEQTPETPSLAHHLQRSAQALIPHYLSNACPILHNGNSVLAPHPVPILPAVLADHQPYANNRLSDSPEKNYVNANIRGTSGPTPTPRQEQISCTNTSSTPVSCQNSFINRLNICGEETQEIPEGSGNFVQTCGENRNMSGNGGRRFTYDDYRRMGAIPKGFPMRNQCDDWSSESSSDSSRGLPLLGSRGSGFSDSSPGLTRRGTLDGSLSPNVVFPEQTLAVSKLMKRLEAAITNGDHRLAATLAHDLALMKVNCVVSKINQPFSIRVYVEDRCMQQGPFVVQVTSMMTVRDLKLKIEGDWGIPAGFQRWILGRQMAEDDTQSLTSFEITQDSMAFLFLVTPEIGNAKSGILPIDKKINNHSVSPCGPSPSTSTSVLNQIPGKSTPSSSKDKTHSSNNLTEPGPHSSKTQPTYNNISKGPPLDKPQSPSAPRKVSSVSQTTGTLLAPSSKKSSAAKRETSPPPRPAKSPTPKAASTKVVSQSSPSTPKKATPSSTPPRKSSKQKEIKKETQSSSSAAETISTATALTLSLQQKLSEFRAVAEQTFGKSNIVTLPPKHDGLRKDASPAPTSSKILNTGRSQESPAKQKVEIVDGKPPQVRKSTKTASTFISSSKEKLAATPPKELPPDSAVVPENRFNGVLLLTPKDTNELKPPERKNTPSPRPTSPKPENSVQTKPEVPNEMVDNSVLDKVELPSPPPSDNVRSPTPDAAPLPKPRGVKRQSTVEKVSQGTESPTIIVPLESVAPKPFPRKVSSPDSIAKREASAEPPAQIGPPATPVIEPPVSAAQHPAQLDPQVSVQLSQPSLHGHPMNEVKIQNTQDSVTVDDCCQTTLPFPAAKPKFSNTPTDSTSATYFPSDPTPSTSTQSGPLSLLRPSAFLSQIKTEGAYSNSPTQPIAHVQPLKQPTPTARVSPSPAISSSSNTGGTAPQPEKEDSAQSYLKMLELMEKQDLILTCEDTECPVCFVPVPKGEGVILRDCLHVFCRECLVGCVQYADDSTVKCPYRDNDYACNYNLQEREIKALVPPDVFEKYLARSVKLAESKIVNTFHCKTPDCTGWCVFEDDVNTFMCPVCKKRNCLTCAAIHEGVDCQKYQRELAIAAETDEDAKQSRLMLEKMIQRGEALDCPACHVVLLKKWGCDWVRCSYCKTEICWVTKGFRWGPGGKGDVSGGCKCGINGVKCHPKCTYCH